MQNKPKREAVANSPGPKSGSVSFRKFACTPDNKARLVCKDGKFEKDQDCNCNVMIDDVTCK